MMHPADKQLRLDRFFAVHRERHLPVTSQRRAVFEAILDRADHPTAEQLYTAVRCQLTQISRMTVHRILGNFVSLGLVAKTCHPGSAARFDPKLHQHHHLVCLDCGRISDLEDLRLNDIRWPHIDPGHFQIQDYNIHFLGRCARCQRRSGTPKVRRPSGKPLSSSRKITKTQSTQQSL